jgi:signal transduction histidine kinase/CheY-like chemotaxis protein
MKRRIEISLSFTITLIFLVISGLITISFFIVYYKSLSARLHERSIDSIKISLEQMYAITKDNISKWTERVRLSAYSVLPYLEDKEDGAINFGEIKTMLQRIDKAQEDFTRINLYSNQKWNSKGGFFVASANIFPDNDFDQTKTEWFIKAKRAEGNVVFTGPVRSAVTNEIITIASIDILDDDGSSAGVMSGIILPQFIYSIIEQGNNYDEQQTFIINKDGFYISHQDPNKIYNVDFFKDNSFEWCRDNILESETYSVMKNRQIIGSIHIPAADWYIVTTVPESAVIEDADKLLINMIVAAVIVFIISCLLVRVLSQRFIVKPIKKIEQIASALAAQDFSVEIDTSRSDEIGSMNAAFAKIRDNLSGIIHSLNADLLHEKEKAEEERDRAENANKAKSNFLASMSHEIRTPMNAIIGMSELISTDNFDKTQKNYFTDIRKMAHALLQIINDILDFSKIESGKMELCPVHFNLLDLYDNICSLTVFTSSSKSIVFSHSFSEKLPAVIYGDEVRIRQIVTNIINNAVKYTKSGFVSFNADLLEDNGAEYMVFTVRDTGIGIKEEDIPKIFMAFEQVDLTKNRGITGTGLGLAITNSFVNMMGGKIEVESVYGKGSTFKVMLPLIHGDSALVRKEHDFNFKVRGSVEVLVVDDAPINLTVALGFLATHGINADTALSAMEAIEKIKKKKYNIVFMDHMMPEIDGVEATRIIRSMYNPKDSATEYFRDMPIVALTANAIAGMRDFFLQSGMNDFISKPIEVKKLSEIIIQFLPEEQIVFMDSSLSEKTLNTKNEAIIESLKKIESLDTDKGLSYLHKNTRIYLQMISEFCKEAEQLANELMQFLKKEDWVSYSMKAHAIKGICAGLSSESLRKSAFALETASKDGRTEFCAEETPRFCEALVALSGEINAALPAENAAKETHPIEREKLIEQLNSLAGHCNGVMRGETNALERAESAAAQISTVSFNAGTETAISEICSLINEFDYEASILKINKLIEELNS